MLRPGYVLFAIPTLSSILALAAGCEPTPAVTPTAPGPRVVETTLESVGLDSAALDRGVVFCLVFFLFVCCSFGCC